MTKRRKGSVSQETFDDFLAHIGNVRGSRHQGHHRRAACRSGHPRLGAAQGREGMNYGYARVSTDGQSLDAQVKQLRTAGAEKVFRETASGARAGRAQLRRVLAQLDKGDVLMVMRLDRLARSTRDLLNTLAAITGTGAGFRSLNDTWADTTTFERELIRARTGEGRERAKANGIKMGRKPKLTDHQKREAIKRRDHGKETLAEIGRSYNVSGWTISRLTI
jgi:DNA invertase Pin-like site-specific DNA recombinase